MYFMTQKTPGGAAGSRLARRRRMFIGMRNLLGILFAAGPALVALAAAPAAPLIHTFSIVARDPATGEMGVAVQSHWFSVGSVVMWAEAGVGAIATQALANSAYGPNGLDLMRKGIAAPAALEQLVANDPERDGRQVAMIDAEGRVSAYTGKSAIVTAGHQIGRQFSVQANMMADETVWPAMAAAFERTPGDLADRMLAALDAGQTAGGDIRGMQSAAIGPSIFASRIIRRPSENCAAS